MKRSGHADLPLHGGKVPQWLAQRMAALGGAISESIIVTREGQWVVIQQGMNEQTGMARRYHWHSAALKSFIEAPHSGIAGLPQGQIMNLVDSQAAPAQGAILDILREQPDKNLQEI